MKFVGRFEHSFDAKWRLTIPAKFRQGLAEEEPEKYGFWLTIDPDECVSMYTPRGWKDFETYFSINPFQSEESRSVKRWFYSSADFFELDSSGRILVPDYLKKHAGISNQVVLVGVNDRIEIWSPERWEQFEAQIAPNFKGFMQAVHEEMSRQNQSS